MLSIEEAEERAQRAEEARLACEQGSPAKSNVSDQAIRHAIDLEISGDPEEEDGDSAAAEPSPRAAATASGYKVGVHEIDEQDVYRDRLGVIKHVRAPAGSSNWDNWEHLSNTNMWIVRSFGCINTRTSKRSRWMSRIHGTIASPL